MEKKRYCRRGFTLIELLVVISIIALLLSILMPSLTKVKTQATKIVCANNLRQQCFGVMLYSNDNEDFVPTSTSGYWLWDVSFWATNEMSRYGGFDYEVYFCPSNRQKKAEDARFWQSSWLAGGGGGPYPYVVPHKDESALTEAEQRQYYRVLPNIYRFDKYDSNGKSLLPDKLIGGEDANWIRRLSKVKSASSTEMVMDVVMNQVGQSWNFFDITAGGIVNLSGGTLVDTSNHRSNRKIYYGVCEGQRPDGGNISFADGHVSWRKFDKMQARVTWGQTYWW